MSDNSFTGEFQTTSTHNYKRLDEQDEMDSFLVQCCLVDKVISGREHQSWWKRTAPTVRINAERSCCFLTLMGVQWMFQLKAVVVNVVIYVVKCVLVTSVNQLFGYTRISTINRNHNNIIIILVSCMCYLFVHDIVSTLIVVDNVIS